MFNLFLKKHRVGTIIKNFKLNLAATKGGQLGLAKGVFLNAFRKKQN